MVMPEPANHSKYSHQWGDWNQTRQEKRRKRVIAWSPGFVPLPPSKKKRLGEDTVRKQGGVARAQPKLKPGELTGRPGRGQEPRTSDCNVQATFPRGGCFSSRKDHCVASSPPLSTLLAALNQDAGHTDSFLKGEMFLKMLRGFPQLTLTTSLVVI